MPTTALRPDRTARAPITALRDGALRLAELVATPLVPADYLDMVSPLRASAALRARIVDVRRETADAATVVLQPSGAWRGHEAGQYIRIGVDVDGVRLWRAYSLTSPAGATDGRISITVKAIPDGVVSNHLVRAARRGTIVQLDQAQGDFTLGETAPAKALFVTAGSGITPVMGMLRSHAARLEDVVLVHSAPTPADVIFGAELRGLASTGRLRLVEQHTDTGGMLDVDQIAALVPDLAERETWACGPAGMLDAIEEHFVAAGIPEQLHTERFRAAVTVAGEGGTVTFSEAGTTVEADGGEHAARRRRGRRGPHAVRVPHGHLLRVRRPSARGHRPRPPYRRAHHRRTGRRRPHPDLHLSRRRRLRHHALGAPP